MACQEGALYAAAAAAAATCLIMICIRYAILLDDDVRARGEQRARHYTLDMFHSQQAEPESPQSNLPK